MERKIGEVFTYEGKTYQVVKGLSCKDCAFSNTLCNSFQTLVAGTCTLGSRKDNLNVVFKEIKDMEIKNNQLTIDIPEGMEIDLENSNFDTGVIYFKKKQPKLKDGDILYVKTKKLGSEYIIINKLSKEAKTAFYVAYNLSSKKIFWNLTYFVCCDKEISILRQATDYEKSQLFDALAKKNKAWDAEKKQIVDLKPKWTPKPFDKIVAFEELSEEWVCDMFSHYSKNYEDKEIIVGIGGCTYFKALPFNEETTKLIGTSDDWEG